MGKKSFILSLALIVLISTLPPAWALDREQALQDIRSLTLDEEKWEATLHWLLSQPDARLEGSLYDVFTLPGISDRRAVQVAQALKLCPLSSNTHAELLLDLLEGAANSDARDSENISLVWVDAASQIVAARLARQASLISGLNAAKQSPREELPIAAFDATYKVMKKWSDEWRSIDPAVNPEENDQILSILKNLAGGLSVFTRPQVTLMGRNKSLLEDKNAVKNVLATLSKDFRIASDPALKWVCSAMISKLNPTIANQTSEYHSRSRAEVFGENFEAISLTKSTLEIRADAAAILERIEAAEAAAAKIVPAPVAPVEPVPPVIEPTPPIVETPPVQAAPPAPTPEPVLMEEETPSAPEVLPVPDALPEPKAEGPVEVAVEKAPVEPEPPQPKVEVPAPKVEAVSVPTPATTANIVASKPAVSAESADRVQLLTETVGNTQIAMSVRLAAAIRLERMCANGLLSLNLLQLAKIGAAVADLTGGNRAESTLESEELLREIALIYLWSLDSVRNAGIFTPGTAQVASAIQSGATALDPAARWLFESLPQVAQDRNEAASAKEFATKCDELLLEAASSASR